MFKPEDCNSYSDLLLNALPIQLCVLDNNGNILAANRAWLDVADNLGARDASAFGMGTNFPEQLATGGVKHWGGQAFAEGVRAVLTGAKSEFSLEYSCDARSGQQWFSAKALPFPDRRLGGAILIVENISRHKRLEHRFRQALESAPNAIVMVDESGIILVVNRQTELAFGYPRAELLGQPVELLTPERFRAGHVDFRQAYLNAPVSRPMGLGRELFGLRKDGTEFPVEIGLGVIEDEDGVIILSSIVDISERRRLNQRFRQAVESAPNAIVMINASGTILMVNLLTERFFGYSRAELVGLPVEVLVPERFRAAHIGFRESFFVDPVTRPMGAGRDLYGLRRDGSEFPIEIGLSVIDDQDGILVLSSIVDITERNNATNKLKEALKEKEMLLKEVYHRVKNNLQVVSSLINLQARNVKNEATAAQLKQSADRIKAMALLHEKLYQSKDLAKIDFNDYIHGLVNHLLFGYAAPPGKIKIGMKIDNIFLDVDTAIPCGLIINELLSNALMHAFPDDRPGEININFSQNRDELILVLSDNGIGFPRGLDFKKTGSLGLQLVATLTNQLMGAMSLEQANGSTFTLRFANPN